MSYVGIRYTYFDFDLRRELLLFDRLALPFLESTIRVWSDSESDSRLNQLAAELEWLAEREIVEAPSLSPVQTGPLADDYLDYLKMSDERDKVFSKIREISGPDLNLDEASAYVMKTGDSRLIHCLTQIVQNFEKYLVRILAAQLNQNDGTIAIPLLSTRDENNLDIGVSRAQVLSIAFDSIPFPATNVSLEQLIDFRNDPDVRADYLALHRWAATTAKESRQPAEIREEIEYLIAQYQRHMNIHKIEQGVGAVETVVTVGAETLENLVKLKWGKAAKQLFSFRKRKAALLKAESGAPGKELAYLIKASTSL
ncbi:MAG: hypothetical protein IIB00_03150 [candidate division Zixibacteria bacterium]|nr:hypothetical protein [candidate division Zixibacteria bacterium]